jgi:hypothetical protein
MFTDKMILLEVDHHVSDVRLEPAVAAAHLNEEDVGRICVATSRSENFSFFEEELMNMIFFQIIPYACN